MRSRSESISGGLEAIPAADHAAFQAAVRGLRIARESTDWVSVLVTEIVRSGTPAHLETLHDTVGNVPELFRDAHGNPAAFLAVLSGNTPVMAWLVREGAAVYDDRLGNLHDFAVSEGNVDAARWLANNLVPEDPPAVPSKKAAGAAIILAGLKSQM